MPLIKKDISILRHNISVIDFAGMNVVEGVPLAIGGVPTASGVVSALEVIPVVITDGVEVINETIGLLLHCLMMCIFFFSERG